MPPQAVYRYTTQTYDLGYHPFMMFRNDADPIERSRVSTGVPGLNEVLCGGLPEEGLHLIHGAPGTGKTTMAMQFLRAGVEQGDSCVFISVLTSARQLESMARSYGWDLAGIELHEYSMNGLLTEEQTIFPSHQVEGARFTEWLQTVVEETKPDRLVVDSISHLHALSGNLARYRAELVALRELFSKHGGTVMLVNTEENDGDGTIRALADGIIEPVQLHPEYGGQRFHLRVMKMRDTSFHGGYHDFVIRSGGVEVFPRVVPSPARQRTSWTTIASGIDNLDEMLHGGIASGSTCMLIGPSGVGKSTLGNVYVDQMMSKGKRAAIFLFEERLDAFFRRTGGVGLHFDSAVAEGRLLVEKIDPGTVSPGEFGQMVENAVADGVQIVLIDSLTGYLSAMPEEGVLPMQLQDLFNFLVQHDVLTLFTVEQQGLVGRDLDAPIRVSEVTDTILLLRYFEHNGELCKSLAVLKKRHGQHEKGVRQVEISHEGLRVAGRNSEFQDLLSNTLHLAN